MRDAPARSLTVAVEQAAALLTTAPDEAERGARAVLRATPYDPRAALILASARRRQGDPAGALTLLEPLARAFPRAANTHCELGLTLLALGEAASATAALRHATALNRELPEAWRALGDLLFRAGDIAGAEAAYAEHGRAAVHDPRLKPAADALFEGRLTDAEARLRAHLRTTPRDAGALHLLAQARARRERHAEAEALLARALEIDPSFDGARFAYARALFQQQKAAEALAQIELLLARAPQPPAYRNLHAAALALLGEDARALQIHESLVAEFPTQPKVWLNYAHALRTVGRREEATGAYRRCIGLQPGHGEAWWGLANLKVAVFGDEDAAAMAAQLARPDLPGEDRLHLNFALGKALEDAGDWEASFRRYAEGCRLRRARAPWDAAAATAAFGRVKALFDQDFLSSRRGAGAPGGAPIFIVGLPRSGSTLIEQILASHPSVEGTMELPHLGWLARSLEAEAAGSGGRYPDLLAELDQPQLAALGEAYLEGVRAHRKLGRPFFIDKMPNNFQHVGLIQLILPDAKIIDARRHPLGAGFSAFKQLFAQGQAFSYDLRDLGRYYRDYVELMTHFDEVSPGRIHRVIYENLVEDPEIEVRRLLDHCGLPFEAACLRFYDNDRAVRTVSSEQVRRPIYRDGLERWRAYEPWLGELKAGLGPALETWRNNVAAERCS
jgi:tetratricopeptide (TPR) repeat protein